ncbi:MarR family transcriptional regulator [Pseudonocardiaceae bacterium YIM PH 21723]|nr:MarR family transcriptional regulator [Pseudonocardiaceae bacterium YIM PH 21723]
MATRVRLAVVRLNRRLRAQRTDRTITLTQLSAIYCLGKCGPLTPGELAAKEGVQPPSMTRVIAALEEQGLLTRRPHPTDGRQAVVELSDDGREYLKEETTVRERWLDSQLVTLTDAERQTLAAAAEIIDRISAR